MRVKCYKVNGTIKRLDYSDFIELYNNKKQGQRDWQKSIEQLELNPQEFGNGRLYKLIKDKHNIFYFTNNICKSELRHITNVITNKMSRDKLVSINTEYKIDKEVFNEKLNCYVKEKYPAKELLSGDFGNYIIQYLNIDANKKKFIILDGNEIKITSDSLRLFKTKGIKCCNCGTEGKYFYKCRNEGDTNFHLILFTEDEVMITKDHILPKSKGGASHLSNYQPLCQKCNLDKGDSVKLSDKLKGLSTEELCIAKLSSIKMYCEKNLNKKIDKKQMIQDILDIIKSNDCKKVIKDKSILNKITKLLGIK